MESRYSQQSGNLADSSSEAVFDEVATEGALYPALHLLRVLAAISIFTGHWSEPYFTQLWRQGQIAIDVFFMAEGFLAMRVLSESSVPGSFGKRVLNRFLQIYPVFVFGLVAGLCAFGPYAFAQEQGWTVANWLAAFVSGLLLLPTFSTLVHGSVFPLNPPTWAIVLELIGFALLAAMQIRRSTVAILLVWTGAVVTFGVLAVFWHDPNAGWEVQHYWGGLPRMIFSFFGGALLFAMRGRIDGFVPRLSPALICIAFPLMHLPTIRYIGWPLLALGVPLLVTAAAWSRRPGWSLVLGAWAARNALIIYVLGYPIMMVWRLFSASVSWPASPASVGLNFVLVTGTLMIAGIFASWAYDKRVTR